MNPGRHISRLGRPQTVLRPTGGAGMEEEGKGQGGLLVRGREGGVGFGRLLCVEVGSEDGEDGAGVGG